MMLATNAGTFLKAARSVSMSSGIYCVAVTSMVIANANAASMKVSSRVIAMPRKRNPPSRGSASRSGGKPDVISCARSFIWLAILPQLSVAGEADSLPCEHGFNSRQSYGAQSQWRGDESPWHSTNAVVFCAGRTAVLVADGALFGSDFR